MKALGVGLGAFALHDVEVVRAPSRCSPSLVLPRGRRRPTLAARAAASTEWHGSSLTHTDPRRPQAIAVAAVAGRTTGAVIPVVTPEEMAAIDAAAPEPVEVLIGRAGARGGPRRARHARRHLRPAGRGRRRQGQQRQRRARRGRAACGVAACGSTVIDAADAPGRLPPCDLVIDAAYGTGFRGEYDAPDPGGAPVLAVDIPSGVDGLTGEAGDGRGARPMRTVTFAALKPGLLLAPGAQRCRRGRGGRHRARRRRRATRPPRRGGRRARRGCPTARRDAHKWQPRCGSWPGRPGMTGAAELCARGAPAGRRRLRAPGHARRRAEPGAAARGRRASRCPARGWDRGGARRARPVPRAASSGPGSGRDDATTADGAPRWSAAAPVPVVVDADGLIALGDATRRRGRSRRAAADGAHPARRRVRAAGRRTAPGPDRIGAGAGAGRPTGRDRAAEGVRPRSSPHPTVGCCSSNDGRRPAGHRRHRRRAVRRHRPPSWPRASTAARRPRRGAFVHGAAGHLGWRRGLVAGDLLDLLPAVLAGSTELARGDGMPRTTPVRRGDDHRRPHLPRPTTTSQAAIAACSSTRRRRRAGGRRRAARCVGMLDDDDLIVQEPAPLPDGDLAPRRLPRAAVVAAPLRGGPAQGAGRHGGRVMDAEPRHLRGGRHARAGRHGDARAQPVPPAGGRATGKLVGHHRPGRHRAGRSSDSPDGRASEAVRPAWAEVDLGADRHNVAAPRRAPSRRPQVCAVVKADGYGHGAVQVAEAALRGGRHVAGRRAGRGGRGPARRRHRPRRSCCCPSRRPTRWTTSWPHGLTPTVYTRGGVEAAAKAVAASARREPLPVHLKVDTGMHRSAPRPTTPSRLALAVDDSPELRLEGVWTHCAVADEPDNPFTDEQLQRFDAVVAELAAARRPAAAAARRQLGGAPSPTPTPATTSCAAASPSTASPRRPRSAGVVDLRPALSLKAAVSRS